MFLFHLATFPFFCPKTFSDFRFKSFRVSSLFSLLSFSFAPSSFPLELSKLLHATLDKLHFFLILSLIFQYCSRNGMNIYHGIRVFHLRPNHSFNKCPLISLNSDQFQCPLVDKHKGKSLLRLNRCVQILRGHSRKRPTYL